MCTWGKDAGEVEAFSFDEFSFCLIEVRPIYLGWQLASQHGQQGHLTRYAQVWMSVQYSAQKRRATRWVADYVCELGEPGIGAMTWPANVT